MFSEGMPHMKATLAGLVLYKHTLHQRLADKRAAVQKLQGGIVERLGVEIWRQESTAEVRDKANVRTISMRPRQNLNFRFSVVSR